jgi:hypothetical protein
VATEDAMTLRFKAIGHLVVAIAWLALGCTARAADPPKFTWTVRPGPAVAIEPGGSVPLTVILGAVPATKVRLAQSTLVDKPTSNLPSNTGLKLCSTPADACGAVGDLAANSSRELWLHGFARVGQFDGTITVAADEKAEGDTIQMSVAVSTMCRKLWGVAAIALGVVLAWFGTVYVRNAISRDLLLSPVVAARATLLDLQERLAKGTPRATAIEGLCVDVAKALEDSKLVGKGLPPRFPLFVSATATSLADFKAYTQTQFDWIAAIGLVVRQGLEVVWASGPAAAGAPLSPADAVNKLSALLVTGAAAPPSLDQLHVAVVAIVAQLTPAKAGAGAGGAAGSPRTSIELQAHITRLSAAGWIFLLAVTALAGSYILVFGPGNAGFGTVLDYIKCVLWGLGLPAGTQLMQATTGSIATSWSVPR